MHRALRHKTKSVPTRKSVRRASTTTEESSDEDSYAGVDQISDSEEDEPDVEEVEERAILASENGDTPRPSQDEAWEGFSDCPGGVLEGDLALFGQDAAVRREWDGSVDEDAEDEESDEETPVVRRVRFEESDSEIDMAYDDVFKDIFIDKDILDPSFRRQIEPDDVSEDGSYWEHEENIDYTGPEEQGDSEDSDSSGSSGYDSEGETTDEDLPEAARFAPPRSVLHRRLSNESSSTEEELPRTSPHGPKPRLFSWKHEPNTPFAMIHTNSSRMVMFNVKMARRYSLDSTPRPATALSSHRSSIVESSPMISNSGNVMMSAMHDTLGLDLNGFSGQALGPPEAFYPFTTINADGTISHDSSSYDTDDLDLDMEPADLEEFFNFDNESDADTDSGQPEPSSNSDAATPVRPTTATSEDQVHPLINHFNIGTGVVGSWRRKQNTDKLLHSSMATEDSLAFSGANQFETIKGVKNGRLQHANTPITPSRKQRPMRAEESSPLASLAESRRKRKFEGDAYMGHKRNRSLI